MNKIEHDDFIFNDSLTQNITISCHPLIINGQKLILATNIISQITVRRRRRGNVTIKPPQPPSWGWGWGAAHSDLRDDICGQN